MDKAQYLSELQQRLAHLPLTPADAADAVQFYEEYFTEAGVQQEQAVMEALGSPAYVAALVALNLSDSPNRLSAEAAGKGKTAKSSVKGHMSVLRAVLLGILASPVALPLALAVVAVLLALLVAAFAVVFSLGVSGLCCMVAGVATVGIAFTQLLTDWPTMLFFVGTGLFSFGIGGLLTRLGVWLAGITCRLLARQGGRFFAGTKRKGEPSHAQIVQ